MECRARGTPMSKRSDSSTTAGSSSPNPPHPTCACSASNTLLAEWSTTPPTVSVFEQSGCDNMRLRWFKNILSLLSTSTDTNRDVVPEDLVRVSVFYKQSCQFGFATHLFGSELKVLCRPGDGAQGHSIPYCPNFAHGPVR